MKKTILVVLAILCAPISLNAQQPAGLDQWARRVMDEFQVPGMGIAVVYNGKVEVARGFGVRTISKDDRVDAHTLFGIASNSKAFTATALAMLVDDGKLNWDDPVYQHLPGFRMYDPYVSAQMTVRDLLCHRSGLGLGAGDLLFWPPTNFTSEEIVHRLRFIKPATSFRSGYAYDNLLYVVAGEVLEAISGLSWAEFMAQRIFPAVGMKGANTSTTLFKPGGNYVMPHMVMAEKLAALEHINLDNAAAAAAINASVTDLSGWVTVLLNGGKLSEQAQLISETELNNLWTPHTIMTTSKPPPPLAPAQAKFRAYGLGWVINDYRGERMISHTGGLPGQVSRVTLLPDRNLGVVVLTNQQSGAAFQAMTYTLLDHYLGAPKHDWIGAYAELVQLRNDSARAEVNEAMSARDADSKPSLSLSDYAGTYKDVWYGKIGIELVEGALVMAFSRTPRLKGKLEHFQHNTFIVRWFDRSLEADSYVTFALNHEGAIEQVTMKPVSPLTDFSFDFHDLLLRPAD